MKNKASVLRGTKLRRTLTSILIAPTLLACESTITADNIILIENTTAIDAINGLRENIDIVIADDKILKVEPASTKFNFKGNITIIDGSNKFIIPGLWDAHVHLSYNDDIGHEVFFPLSLAHGVTYLRDTGGHLDKLAEARALSEADPTLPDLYVAGPLLDGEQRIYDGSSAGFPDISVGLETEEIARSYVDQLAASGVSFIKAYEMLQPHIFAAINDQAEKHGLPVAMHIPLSMTAEEAVTAGADDMQHMRNIELSCAANPKNLKNIRQDDMAAKIDIAPSKLRNQLHTEQRALALPNQSEEVCDDLLALFSREDVYQTPTLTISRFFTRRLFEDAGFKKTFAYMPKKVADGWRTRAANLEASAPSEASLAYDAWILQTLPKMAKHGVPIMAGTDAPIAFLTPGASLHEELIMMVEAGLTPLQALRAATYEPARFLNLEAQQGTIAPRLKADLIILQANPLIDIKNVKEIETVIKNGTIFDHDVLIKNLSR